MLPVSFSRFALDRLGHASGNDSPLTVRHLAELVQQPLTQEASPERRLIDSLTDAAEWLPHGLHAVVGVPGVGQFELAWFIAREVAAKGRRVLFLSLDQDTPTFTRRVLDLERHQSAVTEDAARDSLLGLPISVLEVPTLGIDDIFELSGSVPGLAMIVIDSFDRIIPAHIDDCEHFARRHAAISLAMMARSISASIVVTSSVVATCTQCGAPGPGQFPSVRHDAVGLASEADYLWALNRESYWERGGDCALQVSITGRDGSAFRLELRAPGR